MKVPVSRSQSAQPVAARPRRFAAVTAVVALIGSLLAPLAGALPAQAATDSLTITPIEWNVVGLDSNKPEDEGPNKFVVGARVCNITGTDVSDVTMTWQWTSANVFVDIEGALVKTSDVIPANSCENRWWTIEVQRTTDAHDTTRSFVITASAPDVNPVSTPTTREIYVESLISQNRNEALSVSGPTAVTVGQVVQYVVEGGTAPGGYEQLFVGPVLDGNMFEIISVAATYAEPAGQTNTFYYADACGWDPVIGPTPPSGTYLDCLDTNPIVGGKVGGAPLMVTVSARVIAVGTGLVVPTLYDKSGSSFHYNPKFTPLSVTSTLPTGSFSLEKVLSDPGNDVPDNTAFTVQYSVDGDTPVSVTLQAGAPPVVVSGLPTGARVTFTEDPPSYPAVDWGTPVFSPNPVGGITIGDGTTVAVSVTNSFTPRTGDVCETNVNSAGYPIDTAIQNQLPLTLLNGSVVFNATLNGSSVWADGVELQNSSVTPFATDDVIYLQPTNVPNYRTSANFVDYTITFPNPINSFQMRGAGLNNFDGMTMFPSYQGTPIPVTAANFSALNPVGVNGGTPGMYTIDTDSNGQHDTVIGSSSEGGTSVATNLFQFNIDGPIDQLIIRSGKIDNRTSAVTVALHSFVVCQQTGSFTLAKALSGPAAGLVPDDTMFTVQYSTTGTGGPWTDVPVNSDGTIVAGPVLPAGTVVDFREVVRTVDGLNLVSSTFSEDQITIGDDTTTAVTVTNEFTQQLGSFSLQKQVTGINPALIPAGTEFTVNYSVDGAASIPVQLTAGAAPVVISDLPTGATVTFTEDAPSFGGVNWDAPVFDPVNAEITIGNSTTVPVTVSNPYTPKTGTFSLQKLLSGSGAGLVPDGTIFEVEYSTSGLTGPWTTVELNSDGTVVAGPTLATGTVVDFREVARTVAGVNLISSTFSADQITIGDGTTAAVTVTNEFEAQVPAISLVKSVASIDLGADGVLGAGDEITYAFTVTNTGNVALSDVTVTDVVATMDGGPIALAVGASDSTTFTATYEVTAADVTAGGVENTATATGTPPSGPDVTDVSDTGTGVDGDPVTTPESTETESPLGVNPNDDTDPSDDPTTVRILPSAVDDEDLDNAIGSAVTVDVLVNDSAGLVPSTVRILTPGTNVPVTSLVVDGEGTWSVDATTGAVTFTPLSTFLGDPAPVEYRAANGFGDTAEATVTITYVAAVPAISLVKSVASIDLGADGVLGAGDEITYAFTVTNTGNVALSDVTVTDVVATMDGGPIALAVGASDSTTFTATYEVTAADVTAGGVENTATATGTPPSGPDVTDVSDTGTGVDGDPVTTPESTETESPLGVNPNDDTDPSDDPTTVRILPSAVDDEDLDNAIGSAVTVDVLVNDSAGLVPSTVRILTPGTNVPVTSLVVDGEGTWSVDATTGAVTFTPLSTFLGDPAPVEYRAANGFGDTAEATVTITYVTPPPPPPVTGSFSLVKDLDDLGDRVPDTTEFIVRYSVDGAPAIAVPLIAGANPVVVSNLPLGAIVTFAEDDPVAIPGIVWQAPVFAPENATIMITETLTPVSVTNAIDLTTLAPPEISSRAYVDGVANGTITSGPATVVDRVFYLNLIPSEQYRLDGELVYIENGVIVYTGITAEGLFTPTTSDGETEVIFTVTEEKLAEMGSRQIFIFLTLYNSGNQEVAFDGASVATDPWFDTTEEWFVMEPRLDLAFTGAAQTLGIVVGGLGALAAGLLLLVLGRRRRTSVGASAA